MVHKEFIKVCITVHCQSRAEIFVETNLYDSATMLASLLCELQL